MTGEISDFLPLLKNEKLPACFNARMAADAALDEELAAWVRVSLCSYAFCMTL